MSPSRKNGQEEKQKNRMKQRITRDSSQLRRNAFQYTQNLFEWLVSAAHEFITIQRIPDTV